MSDFENVVASISKRKINFIESTTFLIFVKILYKKNNININIYNDKLGETAKDVAIFRPRSFWGCVGALGTLLVTTALPAARILKIKKYVKSLGGVTDAVRYLLGIKGAASGGEALKNLILELSGIASVTDNCF